MWIEGRLPAESPDEISPRCCPAGATRTVTLEASEREVVSGVDVESSPLQDLLTYSASLLRTCARRIGTGSTRCRENVGARRSGTAVAVPQGLSAGDPAHPQRVHTARQRETVYGQGRGVEGGLVATVAGGPVIGHGGQRCGRSVFRLRKRTVAGPETRDREPSGHRASWADIRTYSSSTETPRSPSPPFPGLSTVRNAFARGMSRAWHGVARSRAARRFPASAARCRSPASAVSAR